jgi:valyl-tRNA synthetase
MPQPLAKSFEPAAIEVRWAPLWEQSGVYAPTLDPSKPSFSIQLPPPNVTGTLHMGHAFNQTIMDALTRYHRMRGFNTLWVPGTDHAGIATQIVVERQLQDAGLSRHDLGRKNFVAQVWDWKHSSGATITRQMRRMGDSVSWAHEYFTMDDSLSSVVNETFVRLYDEGLIYRGKRLVNWDPVLKSAVSDLEVVSEEEDGSLWLIRYPLIGSNGHLTVATTRPETMLGDVALMVHPDDERYAKYVGSRVQLPLTGREIPVIADAYVDREFGTGVVKVTPAHDLNDYAVGQRHGLPMLGVLNLDATLNDNAPAAYRGLDRFVARKKIVADLQRRLAGGGKSTAAVPRCERTGQIIEPMLTDQWFVADDGTWRDGRSRPVDPVVETGEVKFNPEQWVNTYNQWLEKIQDWCISRQLWWGHQIPAWYGTNGELFVGRDEDEARKRAAAAGYTGALARDEDVLDTWYSSALVPFSTLGWPAKTIEQDLFLPSTVLVTGYDIIFFWVARMIMMTTHFTGMVPFGHVYIHGLVRDSHGHKMSKSEGNVLDPVDLIDGIALDPLLDKRATGLRKPEAAPDIREATRKEFPQGIRLRRRRASLHVRSAGLAGRINFDSKRCEGYRNFCNKLWNATKFVLMNCEGQDCGLMEHTKADCEPGGKAHGYAKFSMADRWITGELQRVEAAVAAGFAEYRLDNVANAIYQFVWDEYCDWYIEIAKVQIAQGNVAEQRATRRTLIRVLETVLRLLHPVTPFITAELWERVSVVAGRRIEGSSDTVATARYPQAELHKVDPSADAWMGKLKGLLFAVRSLRSELNLRPDQRVPLYAVGDQGFVDEVAPLLKSVMARISEVKTFGDDTAFGSAAASAPVAVAGAIKLALVVPIDVDAERARIGKEIDRLQGEIGRAEAKLNNPSFVQRAPAAVVEQERQRVADFKQALRRLEDQQGRLVPSV